MFFILFYEKHYKAINKCNPQDKNRDKTKNINFFHIIPQLQNYDYFL